MSDSEWQYGAWPDKVAIPVDESRMREVFTSILAAPIELRRIEISPTFLRAMKKRMKLSGRRDKRRKHKRYSK